VKNINTELPKFTKSEISNATFITKHPGETWLGRVIAREIGCIFFDRGIRIKKLKNKIFYSKLVRVIIIMIRRE